MVEHLDYLADLGVNAIYFTPIFQSASNHRYHTHDYEKVDPMLGGNAALRRLIDEAHARGIRVVLDGVFNHASRGFFQFHDILENGPNSAYLDWFTVNELPAQRLRPRQAARLQGLVGPARPAQVQHRHARPSASSSGGSAASGSTSASTAGGSTSPTRSTTTTSGASSAAGSAPATPRPTSSARSGPTPQRWLQGDMWDAVMNYLFTRACIAFFIGEDVDDDELAQDQPPPRRARRRRGVPPRRSSGCSGSITRTSRP